MRRLITILLAVLVPSLSALDQTTDADFVKAKTMPEYVYAATGEKLRVKHTMAVEGLSVPLGQTLELTDAQTMNVDSLDYWGRFQISTRDYRPIGFGVGKHVVCQFSGGYLDVDASIERRYGILGMAYVPSFHYYVPDYQGNVRLVVDGNGAMAQRNDYYAYGGPWGDNAINQGFQPNKYNGKELDRVHGLDWYDYGARMYDPAMGLFTQLDPLCEQYPHVNPYQYCAGNPVKYVDPDGKSFWSKFLKTSFKVGKQVTKHGVKAFGETATYATAVADLVDDINVLTDSEAPTEDRIWAGVSLASEFLPISINDAKDVGKVLKHVDMGNVGDFEKASKTLTRPKSINQLQKDVERGRAPKIIDRFDKPHGPKGQNHVHLKKTKSSLNQDGSWKDGDPIQLSKKELDYIKDNGWKID